ncbi:Probable transmembrane protein of unknown function [Flavobacterium indicum GPTSA100-9 = DSM 17447]|uniref:Teneurin-like YD-shell domain-containing protein n=1 Tax=Flavobacterium indicum (strain DSM 17447 / CIP 109464 / GPTSA100-9) TaxID=1094466 RepID=H8XQ49_FLAIG|nr:RHS repeat-associated core domain-containing protein [Flavobacterium indicum]CCG52343.1 Probable transmembrane protein of unknown function [Flavobacterium indicum GPTSA100-9 = DSM 17447]
MYYGNTNTDKLTRPFRKYFSGDGSVEIKYTVATGATEIITYIGGDAYSAPALIKSDGTTQNYFYLHRDYLGSIVAITNATGNIVEKRHFDAWGEIVKIQDGLGNNLAKLTFFDRGYTGHEHLQSVKLIHMNGRLYDPKLHRFMQPDNFIQDQYNTQNYNRYAYVLNNPLKHTDPSGEYGIGIAIGIAVAVAVAVYTLDAYYGGKPFTASGLITTSVIAAYTAAMTFGFGEMTSTVNNFFVRASCQAVLHGSFNGGMSYIQGGKFWSGFASGSISSIASSAFTGGNSFQGDGCVMEGGGFKGANFKVFGAQLNESTVGLLSFGAISGGAGSLIGGGNFWQGAVTGLVVSGLNHLPHMLQDYKTTIVGIYGAGGVDASGNPDLRQLVEFQGGKMFSSSTGCCDDDVIEYLKAGWAKGNKLRIYGHSRGGTAAVRIANKLGEMNIIIEDVILFDPVTMYGGGDNIFKYPNVMRVSNYYQRNPSDFWSKGILNANNPFIGSPVSGVYQWPVINNINLTGKYYSPGVLINHLNITEYAIKHP